MYLQPLTGSHLCSGCQCRDCLPVHIDLWRHSGKQIIPVPQVSCGRPGLRRGELPPLGVRCPCLLLQNNDSLNVHARMHMHMRRDDMKSGCFTTS